MSDRPPVVFVGPMGAGKTRIGKRVARTIGAGFTDTDKVIVAEHGPIAALFDARGEPYFRTVERAAVSAGLADCNVLSLGGGAVLSAATRSELMQHRVVFLTVSAAAVEHRLADGKRPLVRGGISDWQRIFDQRLALYREIADVEIDTSHRTDDAITDEVVAWLNKT